MEITIKFTLRKEKTMKHLTQKITILCIGITLIALAACSSNTSNPTDGTWTYPTSVNTKWSYDYYQDTTNTEAGYFDIGKLHKRIIAPITLLGKTGYLLETQTVPGTNSPASENRDTAIYATENGNYFLYINSVADLLGDLIPQNTVPPANPRWLEYLRPASPIGQSYVISTNDTINVTFPIAGVPTNITGIVNVNGAVEKEETLTYYNKDYVTKKIAVTFTINAYLTPGGSPIPLTFVSYFWVANEVGIVRNDYAPPALPGQSFPRFRQTLINLNR